VRTSSHPFGAITFIFKFAFTILILKMNSKVKPFCRGHILYIVLLFSGFNSTAQEVTPPVCFGGQRLLREFILQEMIYPPEALTAKKEGTVTLSFIVEPDGSTKQQKIIQSVSPEIDAEAIRLFRHILWHPATEMGLPVAYKHSIDIRFKVKNYLRRQKNRNNQFFQLPHEIVDESFQVYELDKTDRWPRPIFSAADRTLNNFLSRNLKYPENAYKQNISGTVKLRFVVENSGRISNIQVIESVGGGCTEEAIRVAKLVQWYPGLKNNMAVRTFMPFEVTFDISGEKMGGAIPTPGQVH
jgi:TonB family protein